MRRILYMLACALLALGGRASRASDGVLPRGDLIEDARHLARTIENVHPDPYLRGGGKIAFHRRLHQVLEAIPDSGMTRREFRELVEPLLASVNDGHTVIRGTEPFDPYSPGGIPLYFATYTDGLFVFAVLREEDRDLLGARLVSVEDVPFQEIVARYRRTRGADNEYLLYQELGGQGALWRASSLRRFVPEWARSDSVRVGLRMPGGEQRDLTIATPEKVDFSSFIMPPTSDEELIEDFMTTIQKTDIFYRFLDPERKICLLVIHDLSTYREAFEVWRSLGIEEREDEARAVYRRYHGADPPSDPEEVIAGLPAATEIFRSMAVEMREAGTENLLIDLTQNGGGNSLLSNILTYFVYGRETALSLKGRTTEIVKYSAEYFDKFPIPTLDEINADRTVPLTETDYDLSADHAHRGYPGREHVERKFDETVAMMPTFEEEYGSGEYSGYHRPSRVMVLCDAGTFSAAYTVMFYLARAGAEIVGMPSAQAGNCFGDIMSFELPNSKLAIQVSRKYFELFPDDPERGRVLMPDHVLTYEMMASYGFDPAAILRFALDLIEKD